MHILVTNDDGVFAPGLLALAQELRKLGEVSVLAPDHNWSATGHIKTLSRPLRVYPVMLADGSEALTSDGAPSDCVMLASLGLVSKPIDLVVSGINTGENVGQDMTYSGTVTAAMEGAIQGIAALAVSLDTPENHGGEFDFSAAAAYASRVAAAVIQHGLPKFTLLNINVPYLPANEIKGVRISRLGIRIYKDQLIERKDPRGKPYYWIGGEPPSGVDEAGTDFGDLSAGYVSITPLHMDMTAHALQEEMRNWQM